MTMRTSVIIEVESDWGETYVFAPKEKRITRESDLMFYSVSKGDRAFAGLLGLDLSQRAPWGDDTFLQHAIDLRNNATDQAIKTEHLADADPMADADEPQVVCLKKPRKHLLQGLPKYIDVIFMAIGELDTHSMRVLVSETRCSCFAFELNVKNVEYMQKAVIATWPVVSHPRPIPKAEPDASFPNVLTKKRSNNMLVYCKYTDSTGYKRTYSRVVQDMEEHMQADMVLYIKRQTQEFFDKNHHSWS